LVDTLAVIRLLSSVEGGLMLRNSRLKFGLGALLIFIAGSLAGLCAGWTTSPGKLPSLGDYIGAICATAFRSSPSPR
jgi:hypothetical protein